MKTAHTNNVSVGDIVVWRGSFGQDKPEQAIVMGLEITQYPNEKDGTKVESALWKEVYENRVIFSLDNGHWAYGRQIQRNIDTAERHRYGYWRHGSR